MTASRTVAALLVVIAAFLLACSSDDDAASQPQTERVEQAEQSEQSQPTEAQQAERNQTESNTAQGSEQPQSPQSTAQAAQSRTQPDATAQDRTQPNTVEQNRTKSNKAEQAEPDPQPQQQAQQVQLEQQQSTSDEQQVQQQEQQAQSQPQPQPSEPTEAERLRLRAEEIRAQATAPDLTGLNGWLNGEPTSIALELAKGNVVLVDFWTYTCINCVRTLPFLTAWDEKYREHGLVILGVHTPEFEFEKLPANIEAAIAEHGIEYDVPMDNDYRTWRAFQNRYWPAKYLIGPTDDGSPMGIRYFHFGEGHYPETELEIRAALEAVGRDLSDVPIGVDADIPTRELGNPRQTRELYAGWSRNTGSGGPYAGQDAYFLAGPGIPTLYHDINTEDRQHNLWYLEGLWTTEREYIVHARETEDLEDYMALLVRGRTANVVLTVADDGRPYDVYVQWNGDWLDPSVAAEHIRWDDEGRSFVRVTENDLYRLIFLPQFGEGELILRSNSDQFRIFAFTFGAYVGGE